MVMPGIDALLRIEESLQAVGRLGREAIALEAFDLFIAPGAQAHLSFALPRAPDPPNWERHVAALQKALAQRGRRPHLEYIEELHPTLAPALEAAGLHCEMRAPVMILEMDRLSAEEPSAAAWQARRYRRLDAGDESFLKAMLLRQQIAYGMPADESAFDWLPILRQGLREGGAMGAVLEQGGEPMAGAVIQIGAGVGELAGVWTANRLRKQGLAYALCHRLLSAYAAAGYTLCWLSAAEGAQRLYEKLGFVTVGTQLNYG
jgi:ribosomal protein S18 acetylase RimI-like enzyme